MSRPNIETLKTNFRKRTSLNFFQTKEIFNGWAWQNPNAALAWQNSQMLNSGPLKVTGMGPVG